MEIWRITNLTFFKYYCFSMQVDWFLNFHSHEKTQSENSMLVETLEYVPNLIIIGLVWLFSS